jgi:hypothetical protein
MSVVLQQMQSMLSSLYDLPTSIDISDYLITDRTTVARYTNDLPADHSDEQVLVKQEGDIAHVGVFIDASVLARLASNNPLDELHSANLSDYCTALEGVSHFQYLVWRAQHDCGVSLLELELQAEVDKYAAAILLYTRQRGSFPFSLHEQMFDKVQWVDGLNEQCSQRYVQANKHAARFCRRLDNRYLRCRRIRPEAWLAEIRDFYRCGQQDKLRRSMQ